MCLICVCVFFVFLYYLFNAVFVELEANGLVSCDPSGVMTMTLRRFVEGMLDE